jgi:hypothetical protein
MVPYVALPSAVPFTVHVTPELYVPVPDTFAEHWLACPVCTIAEVHETVTDDIVGVTGGVVPPPLLPPPPPQPAKKQINKSG